jgi:hypothetical protein
LIVGDVCVGKTALTSKLLDEAVSLGFSESISVIDLAPTVNLGAPKMKSMKDFSSTVGSVNYIRPPIIHAPRLEGKNKTHILELAETNAKTIDGYLTTFITEPSPILFINDLTLYLQAGDPRRVREVLESTETSIINAYRGERLREDIGSGLSKREEKALKFIEGVMDRTIELPLKQG